MKSWVWTVCILLVSAAGGSAPAQTVDAQVKAAAQSLFDEARVLVAEGRHAEACSRLAESQRLDPSIGTRFYLAECMERTGRTASAWSLYHEVADLARTDGQAAREAFARDRANRLAPQLARLALKVPAPVTSLAGLRITRDGVEVGAAQSGQALPVDPGIHIVRVEATGKEPWEGKVDVHEPGQTVTVDVPPLSDVKMTPSAPAPSGPVPPPPQGEAPGSTQRTIGLIPAGAGVALAAVGAVFGAVAIERRDRSNAGRCDARDFCDATGVALRRESLDAAHVSTGLFVAAGVAVAAGAVVYLTAPRGRPASAAAVGVAPAPAGLVVLGRF